MNLGGMYSYRPFFRKLRRFNAKTELIKILSACKIEMNAFGDNCWIGGSVTICGGVTIGEGSVVTRDIPANSLTVGNPCKVIRQITDDDSFEAHPEWFAE